MTAAPTEHLIILEILEPPQSTDPRILWCWEKSKKSREMFGWGSPTNPFAILVLKNPLSDKFLCRKKCQSTEFEALKLWKMRSGVWSLKKCWDKQQKIRGREHDLISTRTNVSRKRIEKASKKTWKKIGFPFKNLVGKKKCSPEYLVEWSYYTCLKGYLLSEQAAAYFFKTVRPD